MKLLNSVPVVAKHYCASIVSQAWLISYSSDVTTNGPELAAIIG